MRNLLVFYFFILFCPALLAKPLSAFVDSGEVGQAILLKRLDSCYGITPAHVIGDGFYAGIVGGLPSAPNGDADILMTFGYDLALLKVSGGVEVECNEPYRKAGNLDKFFSNATLAHLITVSSDGSISRQQVSIVDTGILYVRVSPISGGEPLLKGMSGSLLEINNTSAGLLMSVDPETGYGKVLRYDRVTETIAPFFGGAKTASRADTPSPHATKTSSLNGLVISRWSSPPIDGASRAANLLDGNQANNWFARADSFPIDIEVKLGGGESRVINTVELTSTAVTPKDRLPKDFEIMVSNKEKGGWISVASGTLFTTEENKKIQLPPTRGKRLLIRIYSNWGNTEAVGFSELKIR